MPSVPVGGMGGTPGPHHWEALDTPEIRKKIPAGDPDGVFFTWTDRNHDHAVQPEEVEFTRPATPGGAGIANTMAWSSESDRMYFGDTLKNALSVCDFDPAANAIANRRVFDNEFARGLPDGSAVDEEGCLWNCRYGGGCIVRFQPAGSVAEVIDGESHELRVRRA